MENLNELNIGERFEFRYFDWVVLDKDESGVFAVMTDFWQILPFDMYNCNNWEKSSLRRVLNSEFLNRIGKNNLVPVESDLIADNGDKAYGKTTDYVTILSCDQYRKYRDNLLFFKDKGWMWTITSLSCYSGNSGNGHSVCGVSPSGNIRSELAVYRDGGVAPACKFASSNLKVCRLTHLVAVTEK